MLAVADYKRGLGMLSGAFPAKLKAIRILHPNRALALALSIAMPLLSPKMRARQVTPWNIPTQAYLPTTTQAVGPTVDLVDFCVESVF